MRVVKKILIGGGITLAVLVVLIVVFIGPWPTYTAGYEGTAYYKTDLAAIDKSVKLSKIGQTGKLKAGWGSSIMTPEVGAPMAGYGARQDIREYLWGHKPKGRTTGVHDELYVKALALSDGEDTVVIVGSDMLLVPPNVADAVREEVGRKTPLKPDNIYFSASHTHDGPGGFGPGIASFVTGGKYDPKIPMYLSIAFTNAIIDAYNNLEPAKMAHGGFAADEFIHNRARKEAVDSRLSYLVVQKDDGRRCMFVNYSAHPTTVGPDFLQFTGEFPGELQRALEKALPNTMVGYMGGSLGSSGPNAPEGGERIDKAMAMGDGLAKLVLANIGDMSALKWQTDVDVVAAGVPIEVPPFQMRISNNWRVSPLLCKLLGVPHQGWMQAIRINDLFLIGVPGDFSGEISADWKKWSAEKNLDMWTSSFCAGYIGYVSPDKYYNEPGATKEYETGMMSWTGPHQEAFFTALMRHFVESMVKTS